MNLKQKVQEEWDNLPSTTRLCIRDINEGEEGRNQYVVGKNTFCWSTRFYCPLQGEEEIGERLYRCRASEYKG